MADNTIIYNILKNDDVYRAPECMPINAGSDSFRAKALAELKRLETELRDIKKDAASQDEAGPSIRPRGKTGKRKATRKAVKRKTKSARRVARKKTVKRKAVKARKKAVKRKSVKKKDRKEKDHKGKEKGKEKDQEID